MPGPVVAQAESEIADAAISAGILIIFLRNQVIIAMIVTPL
jgi:hypothetical protein